MPRISAIAFLLFSGSSNLSGHSEPLQPTWEDNPDLAIGNSKQKRADYLYDDFGTFPRMTSGCLLMQRAAPVEKCLEQFSSILLVPDDPLPWQAIAFFCSRFDAAGCCRQPAKSLLVLDCSMAAMSKPQTLQYFQQICKINFKLRYKKIKKFFLVGVWPLPPKCYHWQAI